MTRRLVYILAALTTITVAAVRAQGPPEHATFTAVLQAHVRDGLVDYAGLKEDRAALDGYLETLEAVDTVRLAGAPRKAQLAFWINAYNACALRLVIDHYPIKKAGFPASLVRSLQGVPANSIRQISDTWTREFCDVAGKARALDEIEHEIIRPMGEPRIHFAVNCASRSCPVLATTAYSAEELDEQLDAAVQRFVASAQHYRLERKPDPVVYLNKVLDWYKDDFGGTPGVVEFLLRFLPSDDAAVVRAEEEVRVDYLDYDWTLNDTAIFGPQPG
jgi:hypothetical protein